MCEDICSGRQEQQGLPLKSGLQMSFVMDHLSSIVDKIHQHSPCPPAPPFGFYTHHSSSPLSVVYLVFLWLCIHLVPLYLCLPLSLTQLLLSLFLSQDDRLRTPLLKLKLAVCSVMPEQIAKYNMDCMAKVAK